MTISIFDSTEDCSSLNCPGEKSLVTLLGFESGFRWLSTLGRNKHKHRISRGNGKRVNAALLSAACYEKDSSKWMHLQGLDGDKYQHGITSMSQTVEDDQGFSYILARAQDKEDQDKSTIYVAIRGSDNAQNWKSNLAAFDWGLLGPGAFTAMKGSVHTGFYDLSKKLPLSMILAELSMGIEVVFTGHSLGGAVAALCTCQLVVQSNPSLRDQIKCITFGAPLYCDGEFSSHLEDRFGSDLVGRTFEHYIHSKDKVPLLFRHLPDRVSVFLPDWFTGAVVPEYCASGEFKFIPHDDDVNGMTARDHVHQGSVLSDKMDLKSILRLGRDHSVRRYFDSVCSFIYDTYECESLKRDSKITIGPFLGDIGVEVEQILCSIQSSKHDNSNTTSVLRLFLRGRNVWATRMVTISNISISSKAWWPLLKPHESVEILSIKEISRDRNQAEYQVKVKCAGSSFHQKERTVQLNWSNVFETGNQIQIQSGTVEGSYYESTARRLKLMGIHDILVYIRSLRCAFSNRQINCTSEFNDESKRQLKELDAWVYGMVDKLSESEKSVLGRTLHQVQTGTATSEFVMEVLQDLIKVKKPVEGDKLQVTKSEITDFVYGESDRTMVSQPASDRLELVLCVVLSHIFWKKVAVSFKLYIDAVRKKWGLPGVGLNYLMVFVTVGIVHLFTWTTFDRQLRGSSSEQQALLQLFRCDGEVKDTKAYETSVLMDCAGYERGDEACSWNKIVNREEALYGVVQSRTHITKFLKDFLGPTIALRELALRSKIFHIALVGQPGAGKSRFCTSGFFSTIPAKYKSRTTRATMYSLSNKVYVTDYPGVLGNDEGAISDASLSALKESIHTIDFAVVFIKISQRDTDYSPLFRVLRGRKTYICLTHVDTVTGNMYEEPQEGMDTGLKVLENIRNSHRDYEQSIRDAFDLQDVHCFLPSNRSKCIQGLINRLLGGYGHTDLPLERDDAEEMVNRIFAKDPTDLRDKILEAAKLEDIDESDINIKCG
eukprot:CAMPEP_0183736592 /NCGR_PEP_ID=MMETSP0737-20130205/49668_1 /TAXON_ID=385413 /ORGANISM="Thalassiosira miniscula, Strain CCMP1093" /LENGTH=999 /DNA_ID=CAMNT_0025970635 /DNA_START=116 /DNA_END=3115 /DNA_ORIENTATION=+